MVQKCSSLLSVTQHSDVSFPPHICIYITPVLALGGSHYYKPRGQPLTSFFLMLEVVSAVGHNLTYWTSGSLHCL